MIKKEISAGIIFLNKDKTKIFMGRVTNSDPERWDIPKGHIEPGETPLEAALRECREETGFVVHDQDNLVDLGLHLYSSNKDIHLFRYVGQDVPLASLCNCTAYHHTETGDRFPEIDDFKWIDLDMIISCCGQSLSKVLSNLLTVEIHDYYWKD